MNHRATPRSIGRDFRMRKSACLSTRGDRNVSRGGRPRLDPQHRRSITIEVLFSPAEYRLLRQLAGCFPISTFLRLQALRQQPLPAKRVPPVNLQVIVELQRIGNNVNQAVHLVHTGKLPASFGDILGSLQNELRAYHRSLLGEPAEEPHDR
jgi:hypothetical protein